VTTHPPAGAKTGTARIGNGWTPLPAGCPTPTRRLRAIRIHASKDT